jgi:hypothetical protein
VLHNNGLFDQKTDGRIYSPNGSTLDNAGTLRKSGGSGTLQIDTDLINTGAIESLSGNIRLPDDWTNNGILRGIAAYQTNKLTSAGNIAPGASAAPGIATLTLTGTLAEAAAGRLSFEVGAAGVADLLNVTGSVSFDGVLEVIKFGGYTAQLGDTFRVMNYASFTGSLLDVQEVGFADGITFTALYSADHLDLRVTAVPEPATYLLMSGGLLMWARMRRVASA